MSWCLNNLTLFSDSRWCFGLNAGFIDHLYTLTTRNYNLQITITEETSVLSLLQSLLAQCLPQIPHDLTWAQTRAAAVETRRAKTRPLQISKVITGNSVLRNWVKVSTVTRQQRHATYNRLWQELIISNGQLCGRRIEDRFPAKVDVSLPIASRATRKPAGSPIQCLPMVLSPRLKRSRRDAEFHAVHFHKRVKAHNELQCQSFAFINDTNLRNFVRSCLYLIAKV
jgi:hypothetical protein